MDVHPDDQQNNRATERGLWIRKNSKVWGKRSSRSAPYTSHMRCMNMEKV